MLVFSISVMNFSSVFCILNAGEKGDKHSDPEDPPRVRANKKKGLALMTMIVLLFKGSSVVQANKFDWRYARIPKKRPSNR